MTFEPAWQATLRPPKVREIARRGGQIDHFHFRCMKTSYIGTVGSWDLQIYPPRCRDYDAAFLVKWVVCCWVRPRPESRPVGQGSVPEGAKTGSQC